jgi:NADPH:quinone reductase-like Zn-dependent oxidoreductase
MKAIEYVAFGKSNVLELKQVDKPSIKEYEVLIKIKATTVNPLDMKIREGYMQKMMPVQLPFIPGSDAAGVIEVIGSKVTRLKVGDEVFTTSFGGSYAEYIAVKEEQVALKPINVSFNEAASLAVPFATAYNVLVEIGALKAGQKILIHGAAGAVGGVMVQMAKAIGAYVIGTASGIGVAMAKKLGADEIIDYKTQDFTKLVKEVDFVADLVGGETQIKSFEVLKKGGKLLSIVMPPSAELAEKFGVTAQFVSLPPSHKKLEFGVKLLEQGKIKASIAKTIKLEQAAQAQDLVSAGGLNGKIILEIN